MYLANHGVRDLKRFSGGKTGTEIRCRPSPCCQHDNPNNPSLNVNESSGMWRCFACGRLGNWYTLTKAFGDPLQPGDRYVDDLERVDTERFGNFFSTHRRRPVTGNHYSEILLYCYHRGFTEKTLNDWRVTTKGPEILRWPIFAYGAGGWTMVNGRCRVVLNRQEAKVGDWYEVKGGPTGLLIGNHLLDLSENVPKRCFIFEGQWDAMTGYQIGLQNCFSLPNGAQSVKVGSMLRYIPDDWQIFLCMDNDAAGQKALEMFYAQLNPEQLVVLNTPHKDLNEWLQSDPHLQPEQVLSCVNQFIGSITTPKEPTFDTIDFDEDIDEKITTVGTSFSENLNKIIHGGFRGGEVTSVLAKSGQGKTSFVNQIAVHNAFMGVKFGLISLEGTRKALRNKIKENIKGLYEPSEWQEVARNLVISNLEGSNVPWQECVQELCRMVNKGCRLLVMDNLDFICRGDSQNKLVAAAEMTKLAVEKDVHIIMVWQPNKVDNTQRVNSGNQKGYSQVLQDSDNYYNLNRENGFVRVEVEKCRHKGVNPGDNVVWLAWDKHNNCFVECGDDVDLEQPQGATILQFDPIAFGSVPPS